MAKGRSLQGAVRLALAAATAAAEVSALHAQEAPGATAAPVEEVVVTGSRLSTPNESSISPITTVSAGDIQATGLTRVEDVLNNLPMVFAGQNSTVSNGSDGTATVDLRGLGPPRTLVLVNGRRLGPGVGDGRNFSDINQIPAALLERVDILTGGASSVYGADAVAGVVNFILNTHFDGVRIDAGYHYYQHHNHNEVAGVVAAAGDTLPPSNVNTGFGKNVSLLLGSNFADGKGNATLYATFDTQGAVVQGKFDYSACTLDAKRGAQGPYLKCGGSGTAQGGYFVAYGNSGVQILGHTVDQGTGQFRQFATADLYNFGPLNFYQRPNDRWTTGAFVNYDVSSRVNAYAEVMFTRNTSSAQIAPSGSFFQAAFIPCTDPLMTAQERAIVCSPANLAAQGNPTELVGGVPVNGINLYLGRRNVEGGPRVADFTSNAIHMTVGVRGEINEVWKYDAYAQRSTVDADTSGEGNLSNAHIINSLNVVPNPAVGGVAGVPAGQPVCAARLSQLNPATGCVPWNVWVPGGVTAAQEAYLSAPLQTQSNVTEQVVSGSVTGDLASYGVKLRSADSGMKVNVGAEWRSEASVFAPDLETQIGDGAGAPALPPVSGGFRVKEVFTELRLPLVDHAPFAEEGAVEAGYRYSDYSLGFKTNTYKLGLEWAPVRDLRTRVSYNRAVRAPNISELNTPLGVALDGVSDPCSGAHPNAPLAACELTGVTPQQYGNINPNSAAQYNGLTGGNPQLKPETADTLSVGFVLRPRSVPDLTVSVDYFDIKIKDKIAPIGGDVILDSCLAGITSYCSQVHRGPNGTLWLTNAGYVFDPLVNAGTSSTKGFDIKANWRVPLATLGSLSFGLEGTKLNSLVTQPANGGATYDCVGLYGSVCGASDPSWRHVFNATWSAPWDGLDITLRWRYIGSANAEQTSGNPLLTGAGPPFPGTARIVAYNYVDLTGSFELTKAIRLQIGINNIADKDPPIVPTGNSQPYANNCPTITPNLSSCNGNTWPGTYDALGRYLFAHLTAQF
ncbi:MAG: TonB-dependent receptor [Gammaproteobacteria bacterium]|nr:TonB-dependent receptor [Gammaproteobacteria bacterium]